VVAAWVVSCTPKRTSATREERLKWNSNTLTNDYQQFGHKNDKWNADAVEALTEFARIHGASDDEQLVLTDMAGDAAQSAVSEGCDDPMVQYMAVRYGSTTHAKPIGERREAYHVAASNLQSSAYSPLRKFYANLEAAELNYIPRDDKSWPMVRQLRLDAVADLNSAYQDKTIPEAEAYEAAEAVFNMLQHNQRELTNAYNQVSATLSTSGAKPAVGALVKAEFYLQYAWIARGHAAADKVTEEGWRLFGERLGVAEKALDEAWSLDPYDEQIPTLMISICLGQQKPRAEMEKWFDRAMKLDPNNYRAARAKLHFLLPEWYGSREDMLEFGHQCVAATNWGGHVPLILVDAHSQFYDSLPADDRRGYWTLPDVWPDIKAGYERFAQTEPDATKFRYPYAGYAVRCGQWADFQDQIRIIQENDRKLNVNYFGGAEAFSNLVELASSHTAAAGGTAK